MTKAEISVLLYLETRAVDYGGRVAGPHMNQEDLDIAKRWAGKGFIRFGRICMEHINREGCYWVELTDAAWEVAHKERRAKAGRMFANRKYLTTEEQAAG
jgi:hypothetical protein